MAPTPRNQIVFDEEYLLYQFFFLPIAILSFVRTHIIKLKIIQVVRSGSISKDQLAYQPDSNLSTIFSAVQPGLSKPEAQSNFLFHRICLTSSTTSLSRNLFSLNLQKLPQLSILVAAGLFTRHFAVEFSLQRIQPILYLEYKQIINT